MGADVCIVIPPYMKTGEELSTFQNILNQAFSTFCTNCSFISHAQAVLISLEQNPFAESSPGDRLLICHMEEEITVLVVPIWILSYANFWSDIETITRYEVEFCPGKDDYELHEVFCDTPPLGAQDLADQFQAFLERRVHESSRTDPVSGESLLNSITDVSV